MKRRNLVEFLGLPGSGKTTIGNQAAAILESRGHHFLRREEVMVPLKQQPLRKLILGAQLLWFMVRYRSAVLALFRLVQSLDARSIETYWSALRVLQEALFIEIATARGKADAIFQDQGIYQALWYVVTYSHEFDSEAFEAVVNRLRPLLPSLLLVVRTTPEQARDSVVARRGVDCPFDAMDSSLTLAVFRRQAAVLHEQIPSMATECGALVAQVKLDMSERELRDLTQWIGLHVESDSSGVTFENESKASKEQPVKTPEPAYEQLQDPRPSLGYGSAVPGLFMRRVQAAKFTTLAVSVQLALRFIWVFVFARLLGPQHFGIAAAVFVVLEFARVFSESGLAGALIQKQNISRRERSTLFWANLALSFCVFIVLWGAAPVIAHFMGLHEVASLFPVAALSILLGGSSAQFDAHLRKKMFFKEVAHVTIVSGVIGLLAAIGLVTIGRLGPAGLVWGFVAEMGTRSVLLWRQANKHGILPAFEFSFEEVKTFLSFGACEGGGILADIINTRLDQILISYFLGFYALGLYNLASNITLSFASKINSVISTVGFPVFSLVQDDTDKMRLGYIRVIKVIAFVNVPIFAGLAILAPDVVPTVFGSAWRDSVPVVQLLAIVALSRSFIGPAMSAIVAKGFARWSLFWNGGILVIMPGLIVLSAMSQKLSWVAGMLACFYLILIFFSYRILVRPFWGDCGREILLAIGKPALLTGAAVLGIGMLRLSFEHINAGFTLVTSLGVGATFYIALAFVFDQPFTREMLKAVIRQKSLSA